MNVKSQQSANARIRCVSWIAVIFVVLGAPAAAQTSSTQFIRRIGNVNVSCACFSPDGNFVLTGGNAGDPRLWDANTGELVRLYYASNIRVNCLDFSPNGTQFIVGSDTRALQWDTWTGQLLRELPGHLYSVWKVDYAPDGAKIVTESAGDGTIYIWSAATGQRLHTIDGWLWNHDGPVFSGDGSKIAIKLHDQVEIWDANAGQYLRTIMEPIISEFSITCAPLENLIAAYAWYNRNGIQLLDSVSGRVLRTFTTDRPDYINYVSFSKDGTRIAVTYNNEIGIYDIGSGYRLLTVKPEGGTQYAEFSPDGKKLLIIANHTAQLWGIAPFDAAGHWRKYE